MLFVMSKALRALETIPSFVAVDSLRVLPPPIPCCPLRVCPALAVGIRLLDRPSPIGSPSSLLLALLLLLVPLPPSAPEAAATVPAAPPHSQPWLTLGFLALSPELPCNQSHRVCQPR